jgi:hypothetical protein
LPCSRESPAARPSRQPAPAVSTLSIAISARASGATGRRPRSAPGSSSPPPSCSFPASAPHALGVPRCHELEIDAIGTSGRAPPEGGRPPGELEHLAAIQTVADHASGARPRTAPLEHESSDSRQARRAATSVGVGSGGSGRRPPGRPHAPETRKRLDTSHPFGTYSDVSPAVTKPQGGPFPGMGHCSRSTCTGPPISGQEPEPRFSRARRTSARTPSATRLFG